VAYLLTFNCYGTHLRGAPDGSVDRAREWRGGPVNPSAKLVAFEKRVMTDAETILGPGEVLIVLRAIQETCAFFATGLFKANASRALNQSGVRRRWFRGGNARRLGD